MSNNNKYKYQQKGGNKYDNADGDENGGGKGGGQKYMPKNRP